MLILLYNASFPKLSDHEIKQWWYQASLSQLKEGWFIYPILKDWIAATTFDVYNLFYLNIRYIQIERWQKQKTLKLYFFLRDLIPWEAFAVRSLLSLVANLLYVDWINKQIGRGGSLEIKKILSRWGSCHIPFHMTKYFRKQEI